MTPPSDDVRCPVCLKRTEQVRLERPIGGTRDWLCGHCDTAHAGGADGELDANDYRRRLHREHQEVQKRLRETAA